MKVYANQPSSILMIRPQHFDFPLQSLSSILSKTPKSFPDKEKILNAAFKEFNHLAHVLQKNKIEVLAYEEKKLDLNNAIFLNKWISFHEDGTIILYPSEIKHQEWRGELIISLQKNHDFDVKQILDFTHHEKEKQYMAGSARLIFDNFSKVIYTLRAPKSSSVVLNKLAEYLEYRLLEFNAYDCSGNDVNHISSVLTLSERYVLLCSSRIKNHHDLKLVKDSFATAGRDIIEIECSQEKAISGNIIELKNFSGESILIMSQTAFSSLHPSQLDRIRKYSKIVPVQLENLEMFGMGILRGIMSVVNLPKMAFA